MGFVPKLAPRLVLEANLLVWWGCVLIVGRKTKVPSRVAIQRDALRLHLLFLPSFLPLPSLFPSHHPASTGYLLLCCFVSGSKNVKEIQHEILETVTG